MRITGMRVSDTVFCKTCEAVRDVQSVTSTTPVAGLDPNVYPPAGTAFFQGILECGHGNKEGTPYVVWVGLERDWTEETA